MKTTKAFLVAAAVMLVATVELKAQDSESFRSPSGNIACMYNADRDGASLRCDIMQISGTPPRRPRDCELEWGKAFEIAANSTRGQRICHGDTVADPSARALAYGQTWERGGFTCFSAENGMTCRNARGAGFELSRARQNVF